MKDDVLILNTLGRRHLPRLLPVIVLAAAAVAAVMIRHGSLAFSWGRVDVGAQTYYKYTTYLGSLLFAVMWAVLLYAYFVLRGPSSRRSAYRYTVGMLRVSERRAFQLCCIFNLLVYLLIWALLCCAAIIIGKTLDNAGALGSSPQDLYYSYMMSPFIQLFVPMDNAAVTVSMPLMIISFGMITARDFAARMKGKAGTLQFFALIVLFWASRWYGSGRQLIGWVVTAAVMFAAAVIMFFYQASELGRGTNAEVDDGE